LNFDFSGRLADTSYCKFEGPDIPKCLVQDLEGDFFTGSLQVDENGRNIATPSLKAVKFFDSSGKSVYQELFSTGNISLNSQAATLSLQNNFPPTFSEQFTLNFVPSPSLSLTEPFGSFLSGSFGGQQGASRKLFQSIDIVSATITSQTSVSVPEASSVPSLLICFVSGLLLQKKSDYSVKSGDIQK
ncbi:MAG: hypothetical protein PUP91_11605, partial [Rhizonema sp. PD37]|nr:hypothetical protein [Rhizonema sp. PD37]